ncbi:MULTISPECIES: hypothetical protein [Streptomyces]|uniref:Uncharacterized protein n=1 Tax=Streptomyces flaveolus TaxID=67297 RepID=A0ABV3AL06_9ACTN|nr:MULTISPECIES: hypothetical protein [unclassified Streptomyces]KMS87232.1 hypothetical protein ACZ91_32450 [Streptomyces regensis]MBG7701791.1 hypothetical protein [Streptomyces sp. MC1]
MPPTHTLTTHPVLLRAGLLDEADKPMRFAVCDQPIRTPYITAPVPPPRAPRQCADCYAWIAWFSPGG